MELSSEKSDHASLCRNKNANNNSGLKESDVTPSDLKEFRLKSYKQLSEDRVAKIKYLFKPGIFAAVGTSLMCAGITLTVFHFMYEDSLSDNNPPFFTYGPITFASGIIILMVGIVWLSVKYKKWVSGTATPITRALALATTLAASATLTSEQLKMVRRESISGLPRKETDFV